MGKRKRMLANNRPDPASYANHTPFRQVERKYKQKHRSAAELDLCEVYDPYRSSTSTSTNNNTEQPQVSPISDDLRTLRQALRAALGWSADLIPDAADADLPQAVVFPAIPGLILLPAALPRSIQTHLTHQSIATYTRPPNKSNMTAHWSIPPSGLWANRHMPDPIPLHAEPVDPSITPSAHLSPEPARTLMDRLRWCTLGFQYNWTTKKYYADEFYTFPSDLAAVTHAIVHAVESLACPLIGKDVGTGYPAAQYTAQAGVLNVYGPRDTLMAHVDESEPNMRPPLVSISLGAQGVFLIGGPTRETRPIALRVRSGDVVVMSAGAREAFHGVPRILDVMPDWMHVEPVEQGDDGDRRIEDVGQRASEWREVIEYLRAREARVNLNVRQVN
ncbi:hypothetical protein BCR44DRAFT_116524 [Catenaria anguillulae PL171]|uniref:Fe2OG dioxygenase domain-containing protein n=1 Tax=Catenaria anguillulae PL171 TaxID=765915 RepID=A0A1Y2HML6_9FUNG|nr:hypothetical protein BCR44DRAFT_116524 [Catenaria anguillulae PL171]